MTCGERKTLAFVLNHPFYRVGARYYAQTPNILDLMSAFLEHVDRVVLCGPALKAAQVEERWMLVPPELEVFELPYYADNVDLIVRAPVLLPRLLYRILPAIRTWDVVAGVAPSGFGLVTVLVALLCRRAAFLYVRGNQIASLTNIYRQSPWKRRLILASFWPLDIAVRVCSRLGVHTFAKGAALAERYRGRRVYVLSGYARPTIMRPPIPSPVNDPEALRRLLYVGRLSTEKGVDILLRAMAVLDRNCQLTVAGDGPDAQHLRTLVQELGLRDRVHFVGYVLDPDHVRRLYLRAGIVVVPSRSEGVPVAMIDAMGLGRVVVATRIGGIPTVLQHEQNGLLVPVEDPDALAQCLCRLIDDPDFAFEMARAASVTGNALSVGAQAQVMVETVCGTQNVA